MSVSFAADSTAQRNSTSESSASSIIINVTEDVLAFGAPVTKFHCDPETRKFIGSDLKFRVGTWTLTIQKDQPNFTTQNSNGAHSQSSSLATLPPPHAIQKHSITYYVKGYQKLFPVKINSINH